MGMFVVAPAAATPFHPSQQVQNHESLIPLLAAAPCFNLSASADLGGGDGGGGGGDLHHRNRTAGIHLWQNSHQQEEVGGDNNYPKKTINFASCTPNSLSAANAAVSGGFTCQDCGNQAKKDCLHRRCRTCCRSRGFDCDTHVKSTWVPAARRRERHSAAAAGGGRASSGSTSGAKRPRIISSAATTTSHTSNSNTADTGSSRRDTAALPREVKAPAVFRCVRVTAVDGGDDEFAYQAVVKIGGHVFKGFLYDQGLNNNNPKISQFHSAAGAAAGGGGGRNGVASTSPMISPMELYGGGGGGIFLGGSATHYGFKLLCIFLEDTV